MEEINKNKWNYKTFICFIDIFTGYDNNDTSEKNDYKNEIIY